MTGNAPLRPGTALQQILVVEDDAAVREVAESVLLDAGYVVHAVADGRGALQELTIRRPDLILLDLSLPEMDGWEVLARIKEAGNPPPVVIMTAYSAVTGRAFDAGAAAAVLKPFNVSDLVGTVDRLMTPHGTSDARG